VDVPLLPGSRPRRLAAISHQTPTLLTAASRLSRNESWSSLYFPCTDRTVKTLHPTFFLFLDSYRRGSHRKHHFERYFPWWRGVEWPTLLLRHYLFCHCLATGVFAQPFASNGCHCWLHNSDFQQICHYRQKQIYSCNKWIPKRMRYTQISSSALSWLKSDIKIWIEDIIPHLHILRHSRKW
jgi:hypothetical protein